MNISLNASIDVTTLSSSFQINAPQCMKDVSGPCEFLNESTTCFGSRLPHDSTSFELVTDANNLQQAKEKLLLWSGLRAVPRCWDVIQPLLCSVYYPSCKNGKVHLLDRSLCIQTRGPCQIVDTEYGWPDFLLCQNDAVFQDGCTKTQAESFKFNKSDCEPPLISTNNSASYYDEVDGCGLQCMNPLFDQTEHDDIHSFIAGWAATACICTIFAMLSFFIDWKNSSKYPARIIFYINLCFFIGGVGWLAQFFPGARDEIVCRKDGTMRLGEPVQDESPSCVIIFVLVYFFLMAGITWFDILCYSWYLMFKALGTYKDPLIGKAKAFHIIAWSVPFVLMLTCLLVTEIDGDSMSGICFIGYKNYIFRLCLLLVPVGIVLLVGGFFIFRGFMTLFGIRKGHPGLLSESAVAKINWTMIRIGIFAVLAFLFVFVTFAAHLYDYTNQAIWEKSFRDYIKCQANVTILEQLSGIPPKTCVLESHPNLSVMKLNIVALFGTGIVMSTWVWTKSSAENWRRAWYKLIGRSDNETKRIRHKSRIIAKAFAMRDILKNRNKKKTEYSDDDGSDLSELEYSEHTMSHQDPVGMNFDLHSVSREMSSTWMRNVPKIVERRGGILPEDKSSARNNREARAKKSTRVREKATDVQPGLWAVSQYIDGSNMKTKTEKKKVSRKTAPSNNLNSVFIGTSPYKFPINQRSLPPAPCHRGRRQMSNVYHAHPLEYTEHTRQENILHVGSDILPGMPHADLRNCPCYPPGYVEGDCCSSTFEATSVEPDVRGYYEHIPPFVQSYEHAYDRNCGLHNSNNNGNRVHYFTSPNRSTRPNPLGNSTELGVRSSLSSAKTIPSTE